MSGLRPDLVWNTWDYRYPGSITHQPSGLTMRYAAYSGTAGFQDFNATITDGITYGPHTNDGSYNQVGLEFAGTEVSFETAKPDWHTVVGRVTIVTAAELSFRFESLLELGVPAEDHTRGAHRDDEVIIEVEDVGEETYRQPRFVYATFRSQVFCLATTPGAVVVATHPAIEDHGRALETTGWMYVGDESHTPTLPHRAANLRFSSDTTIPIVFALAQATDRAAARQDALDALSSAETTIVALADRADAQGPEEYKAVRDIVAWNTVWDPIDAQPYTALARSWNGDLGGRGVWMSDVLYSALLAAHAGNWEIARANLRIVLNAQQPDGNIACLLSGHQEWVDRTQLPVAAYVVHRIYLLTGDRTLLEEAYPILLRQQDWYFSHRNGNDNDLLEYGSSPTGHAPWAHTRQGAMNESGMDNMPIFDGTTFNEHTHTLEFEEPGHNSLIALDAELLSSIAAELGRHDDATRLRTRSERLRSQISDLLWDPSRSIFAGRNWDGTFASSISPTSFFPLVAGAATDEQTESLVTEHLLNEDEFWGVYPLPSTPFNDPISLENMYWRGRIWAPLNLWVWEGLRRSGRQDLATILAQRGQSMFAEKWDTQRHAHENYHISDPSRTESPESDPFYSWAGLLPLISALDALDIDADGLNVGAQGGGHLTLPGRIISTRVHDDRLEIAENGVTVMSLTPSTRISHLTSTRQHISLSLERPQNNQRIFIPAATGAVASASESVVVERSEAGATLTTTTSDEQVKVQITFTP